MTPQVSHRAVHVGAGLALLVVFVSPARAQETPRRLTAAEISAMTRGGAGAGTSGVEGITTTVLSGNPSTAGPYTVEIRVPAHTRIAAHTHRDDRSAVVVAGTWWFGYGTHAADSLVIALGPGSYYTEPAGRAHFAMTSDQAAVVYITGFGPTDTRYIDARADPRRP